MNSMKQSLNIQYNYLIDGELPLPSNFDLNDRVDPDCGCKKLYDDILLAFFNDSDYNKTNGIISVENWHQKYGQRPEFYTIRINGDTDHPILLSSDYIGPSVYWAIDQGIPNEEILEFLGICRTIGGHMIWPRGRVITDDGMTINRAKGGSKGVYDRIDWTLLLIKIFYEHQERTDFFNKLDSFFSGEICKYNCKNNLELMYDSIKRSYDVWFHKFHDFARFCKQFCLVCSFVDSDYNVIKMIDWFPILPNSYTDYISNLCKAVQTRNNIIVGKI